MDEREDDEMGQLTVGIKALRSNWVCPQLPITVDLADKTIHKKGKDHSTLNIQNKLCKKGEAGKGKGYKGYKSYKDTDNALAVVPEDKAAKGKGNNPHNVRKLDREHMQRRCKECEGIGEWRQMECSYETYCEDEAVRNRMGTSAEKSDLEQMKQYGEYTYTCVICVSERDGIAVGQAARNIKQPRTKKGIERCNKFEFAKLSIQQTFTFLYINLNDDTSSTASTSCPADSDRWSCTDADAASEAASDMGTTEASSESGMASVGGSASSESGMADPMPYLSKKKLAKEFRRQAVIKVTTMTTFFKPMAEILFLKNTDMEAACIAAAKLQKWIEAGNVPEDEDEDMKEGDTLEINFEETLYKQRAFADHENPHQMRNAADYSDRWFKSGVQEFRVYYKCIAGGIFPCDTVIEASSWDRFKEARESSGQRWYCKMCHAKYKTKYGVLVEIINGHQAAYCQGELPPFDIQDAKLMKIEEDFKQYNTPEELLAALPNITPLARGDFLQATPYAGHFKFNRPMMEGLEMMDWSQLYNMTGVGPKPKK